MTIQDKTEAYYMAKFEDYIRQCRHLAVGADRLVPGMHTYWDKYYHLISIFDEWFGVDYWGDGYEKFELSGKILNNGNEYPEVDEYLREMGV